MKKDGLARMLEFLDLLDEKKVTYFITRYSPDGLTVTVTLYKIRVEVEFTVDEMRFSFFEGTEDVLTDESVLYGMIDRFVE